jgi:DNA-binding response OmpR family regulator
MSTASPRPDRPEQALPSTSPRALVVDDDRDLADSLSTLLRLSGYESRSLYDGFAALKEVESFRPDVVVLDIAIPGLDGFEVARRLRALPALQGVLLIALTGYGQIQDRVASVLAGIDHHIVKPVNTEVLLKLIKAHVAPGLAMAASELRREQV